MFSNKEIKEMSTDELRLALTMNLEASENGECDVYDALDCQKEIKRETLRRIKKILVK